MEVFAITKWYKRSGTVEYFFCLSRRRWTQWRMNRPIALPIRTASPIAAVWTPRTNSRTRPAISRIRAISRTAPTSRPTESKLLKYKKGHSKEWPNIFIVANLKSVVNRECVYCAEICVLHKSIYCCLCNTPSWKRLNPVVLCNHKEEHQTQGEPQKLSAKLRIFKNLTKERINWC